MFALSGVGDAVSAFTAQQEQAAVGAAGAAQKQVTAARQVADAHRAVRDAEEQVTFAEEDLSRARQDAVRELDDLKRAQDETAMSARRAALTAAEAERALAQVLADPSSSAFDIRDAELSVDEARAAQQTAREDARRARQERHSARRATVRGMPQVAAAERALAQAQRQAADAARGLTDAATDQNRALDAGGAAADRFQLALKDLSPAGQRFVKFVTGDLLPKFKELKHTAQEGMLPGVERGIRSALKNFGPLNRVVEVTSETFGKLAERAGRMFGSKAWGRDIETIGQRNAKVLERGGKAGLHLADALRHVTVAAGPLVGWISRVTLGWARNIEKQAQAGRESGRMERFFARTRHTLETLGGILENVAVGLFNVGKAGRPLGDDILESLEKASKGWREWTESVEGRNELREYFRDARPGIFEFGRLARDITKAFVRLGSGDQVAPLLKKLRTELLPVLESITGTLTAEFAPVLIDALVGVAKLLEHLAGNSGPLTLLVELIGKLAEGLSAVLDAVPPLDAALSTLVIAGGLYKALAIGASITGIKKLIGLTKTLGVVGAGAGVASGAGAAAGGAIALSQAQRLEMLKKGTLTQSALAGAGGAAVGGGASKLAGVKSFAAKAGWVGLGVAAFDAFATGFAKGGADSVGGAGAMEVAAEQLGHTLTMGLAPTAEESARETWDFWVKTIKAYQAKSGNPKIDFGNFDQIGDLSARQERALARLQDRIVAARELAARGLNFRIRIDGSDGHTVDELESVERMFHRLETNGARSLGALRSSVRMNMRAIRRIFEDDPKAMKEALTGNIGAAIRNLRNSMRDGKISADDALSEILRLSRVKTGGSKQAITENFDAASEAIKDAIGRGQISTERGLDLLNQIIVQKLVRVFQFTQAQAVHISKTGDPDGNRGREGGAFRATGGWIGHPGQAGRDTVPAMLGKGEAVLNRHQQPLVNAGLAAIGMPGGLPELFQKVQKPHYLATGGYVQGAVPVGGPAARALASGLFRLGFNVTSGRRATSTYHGAAGSGKGDALDFGHSANDLSKLARVLWPHARDFVELFMPTGPPGGPVPHGGLYQHARRFHDAKLQGQHQDHTHVAALKMIKGLGGLAHPFRAPTVTMAGAPEFVRAIAQQAVDHAGEGVAGRMNRIAGFSTGGIVHGHRSSDFDHPTKNYARIILGHGRGRSWRKGIAAVTAAMTETGGPGRRHAIIRNPRGGHSSSVGLFQMLDDKGSVAQRHDPHFASRWFFRTSDGVSGAQPIAAIAQAVERSAYAGRYAQYVDDAMSIAKHLGFGRTGDGVGARLSRASDDPRRPAQPTAKERKQTERLKKLQALKRRQAAQRVRKAARRKLDKKMGKRRDHRLRGLEGVPQDLLDQFDKLGIQVSDAGDWITKIDERYGLTDEQYVLEDADGNPLLNQSGMIDPKTGRWVGGIDQRVTELDDLIARQGTVIAGTGRQGWLAGQIAKAIAREIERRKTRLAEFRKTVRARMARLKVVNRLIAELAVRHAQHRVRHPKDRKGLAAIFGARSKLQGERATIHRDLKQLVGTDTFGGNWGDARGLYGKVRGGLTPLTTELGEKTRYATHQNHIDLVGHWDTRKAWQTEKANLLGTQLPKTDPAKPDDNGLADLLREKLHGVQRENLILKAQAPVFRDFFGELVGQFAHGTDFVPRTGLALVHRGERITPDPEGPYGSRHARGGGPSSPPVINLYVDGDIGPLMGKVRAEIDGRAADVTERQIGGSLRRLHYAPGR